MVCISEWNRQQFKNDHIYVQVYQTLAHLDIRLLRSDSISCPTRS